MLIKFVIDILLSVPEILLVYMMPYRTKSSDNIPPTYSDYCMFIEKIRHFTIKRKTIVMLPGDLHY